MQRGRFGRRGHLKLVVGLTLRAREQHPLVRAAAVPVGSVRAGTQAAWLDAVEAHPDFAGLRADAWAAVRAVARSLAWHADWRTMLSRPTHAVLAERAEVSVRTVARVRARLQAAGLLGIVTPGTTRDLVDPEAGPCAQCYVLTIPLALADHSPTAGLPQADDEQCAQEHGEQAEAADSLAVLTSVDGTVIPSKPTFGGLVEEAPARARRAGARARFARGADSGATSDQPSTHRDVASGPRQALDEVGLASGASQVDQSAGRRGRGGRVVSRRDRLSELEAAARGRAVIWPAGRRPVDRAERTAAAAEARRVDPVLRRVSTAHVAALLRDWHLAGWTLTDVRTALQVRPDGTPWPHTLTDPAGDVRHVPGWVRHRLASWRTDPTNPASPPAHSPRQRATAAAEAARAEHAQLQAEHAAMTAAAVPPALAIPGWAELRARHSARLREARRRVVDQP
jgi:hypothetical protein